MLTIDGSLGEGGGQVLRTALGLAMLRGEPVRVTNVRANRPRPGLARQHLAAVRAAAQMSRGHAEGATLGSTDVTLHPGHVAAGSHRVDVGSAGSATLVLQTVLPALLTTASCPGETTITVVGGTHNPMAPPAPFFGHVFLPALRRFGADVSFECVRPGFYLAGGGEVRLTVRPVAALRPIDWHDPGRPIRRWAEIFVAGLPDHVADREARALAEQLPDWPPAEVRRLDRRAGPANAVVVGVEHEDAAEVCIAFGKPGRRAEQVAADAAGQMRAWLESKVPVGPHLADQLLIPLALAGGTFTTARLDAHAATNAQVIRQITGTTIELTDDGDTTRIERR